jgi:hypothetical protein
MPSESPWIAVVGIWGPGARSALLGRPADQARRSIFGQAVRRLIEDWC